MANGYSLQTLQKYGGTSPVQAGEGAQTAGDRRTSSIVVTGASLVAQGVGAIGDTILLGKLPAGAQFIDIQAQTDTVFTGVTLQFGYGTTPLPASIVSATTFGSIVAAAANVLNTLRPVAQRVAGQLAADQYVFATVTGAALPAAFNMELAINYMIAN